MPIKDLEKRRLSKKIYERLNHDKARARCKKYREKDPDKYRKMCVKRQVEYRKRHPDRIKSSSRGAFIKKRYGINEHEFQQMMVRQNGKCAICGCSLIAGKHTHIDHCHKTGTVRALLCGKCNPGLGMFNDSIELLSAAIAYLNFYSNDEQNGVAGKATLAPKAVAA